MPMGLERGELCGRARDTPADKVPVGRDRRETSEEREAITDLDMSRGNRHDDGGRGGRGTGSEGGAPLWIQWSYLFPWAVVTNYCQLGVLDTAGLSSLMLWRPQVQNRGVSRVTVPPEALGENPSPPLQLPVVADRL